MFLRAPRAESPVLAGVFAAPPRIGARCSPGEVQAPRGADGLKLGGASHSAGSLARDGCGTEQRALGSGQTTRGRLRLRGCEAPLH
eukprot:5275992-Pyramimonas_sp.AAC.1